MGSVKDLLVIRPAFENRQGLANFVFSDRYSVFDWGEMPDHIPGKGLSLALMAAYNFEELEHRGIKTHYQGLVSRPGKLIRFSDINDKDEVEPVMQISLARVYRPTAREFMDADKNLQVRYDYSFFERNRGKINNYLLGLEIIFRNGLPTGSSVFEDINQARARANPEERRKKMAEILKSLGLKEEPLPGQMLPRPVMGFSTKLEPGDRRLGEQEAYRISGLKRKNFRSLKALAVQVNEVVTDLARASDFAHYDGKIELVYNRGLLVGDVPGTFDENRFSFRGEQISKEVLRQWYKKNQPEFVSACEKWKKTGSGWQERCEVKPVGLPGELATLVSRMYMAGCNRYTGKKVLKAPELEQVMEGLRSYR